MVRPNDVLHLSSAIGSLFPGCGDLDLGFNQPGFQTIWANEFDKSIWETYEKNYPETVLDRRDISSIPSDDIPECVGII
ncbi:DNA cytosine methyltransferase [Leptolyngbya sp. UWPOB_LEPTO1]|uniref:DNA cytosine methyltransferase n=1 Tax=Leptolyngbya sp. UWPOB_LEPTO1 TaxID=2815653 RepID=UPI00257B4DB3|nr:DNA cytosine methyltransferase [Leptolyngbya sp. UWPOB_LEPTO1]